MAKRPAIYIVALFYPHVFCSLSAQLHSYQGSLEGSSVFLDTDNNGIPPLRRRPSD
ncbi:MAG: hypothetical protein IPG00_12290 [Saprospiraceae bacterium]|nr:hypothetical protein [Saprospiraceae bacterium]